MPSLNARCLDIGMSSYFDFRPQTLIGMPFALSMKWRMVVISALPGLSLSLFP
jgi:hypothetical protein